jgi:hypothetical protein
MRPAPLFQLLLTDRSDYERAFLLGIFYAFPVAELGGIHVAQSETLLASMTDGVKMPTLNRPDKLNSLNEEMHRALRAAKASIYQRRRNGEHQL